MTALKIIFMGTPEFATPCLQAVIDSPHEIVAVVSQPDRPVGRGRKMTPPPIAPWRQRINSSCFSGKN